MTNPTPSPDAAAVEATPDDAAAAAWKLRLEGITLPPVSSVAELIDLSEFYVSPPGVVSGSRWAFRGQPRGYRTLVPSFQRQFTRKSDGTAELIEKQLIQDFRVHYAKLSDRSREMPSPMRIDTGKDLRCLSVMQHYEIPTRLLDWTTDLWTALYFACSSDSAVDAELWMYDQQIFDGDRTALGLWSLNDQSDNPPSEPDLLFRNGEERLFEIDPKISPRMRQQFGHHTVSNHIFSDHAPLLFAVQQRFAEANPLSAPTLRRLVIRGSSKSNVVQYLATHKNITASTIFPDVVGLGRFLRWQFESLRTMLL